MTPNRTTARHLADIAAVFARSVIILFELTAQYQRESSPERGVACFALGASRDAMNTSIGAQHPGPQRVTHPV